MSNPEKSRDIFIEGDARWRAVVERDGHYDGEFVYAVKTTGIYCRPSCAARRAKSCNVRFYADAEAAETAGFRPCLRCRPDEPNRFQSHAAAMAAICRVIETSETIIGLHELARRAQLSPHHFHRVFKAATGVTPRAYALAQRAVRMRETVRATATVTEAIYESGFASSGRFYENSREVLGMTPTDYRAGGANANIVFALSKCSLGHVLVARSDIGICSIALGHNPEMLTHELEARFPNAARSEDDGDFAALIARVVELIESPDREFDLPLDIRGTAFQQRVWQELRKIAVGETATYTQIAQRIDAPKAVRAVAGACAANTIAVVIPCHRVVKSDGALSGYRWGVERKRALLDKESQQKKLSVD